MASWQTNKEKNAAKEEIAKSIRDLYSLKITLPLGNPNLKLVHTNQFLFTELPTDVFELANMSELSKALNSTYSRYSGYEINRWYIEGVTINNEVNGKATMELDLNPFASDYRKYHDDKVSFEKAYTDAFSNKTTTTTSAKKTTTTKKKSVASTTKNDIVLKDVKGFKKKDQEYIKNVTDKALKKYNFPRNKVKQAKAIHEYYKAHHVYRKYYDMDKMNRYGFEGCWKHKNHNCGDGAATLQAMMKCIGLNPDIMLGHGHYWIRVKINGTYYYCDQAGAPGAHNTRVLGKKGNNNNVWEGTGGGHVHNSY